MAINAHHKVAKNVLAGAVLFFIANNAFADSLNEQRERYNQVKTALDNKKMEAAGRMLPTLKNYPLYPYLEYRILTQDASKLTNANVNQFITAYPNLPASKTLRNTYLTELAKRENWADYLNYAVQPLTSTAQQCNFAYAQYTSGKKSEAFSAIEKLWGETLFLPSACDKVISVWRSSGSQTPILTLQRINLASSTGSKDGWTQADYLVKQLTGKDKQLGEDVVKAYTTPETLLPFSQKYTASPYTQDVVQKAFNVLARKDADKALSQLPDIARNQNMTDAQKKSLEGTLSGQLIRNDVSASFAKWRDGVIAQSKNTNLIERRIRLALGNNDTKNLSQWISALPADAKKKEEWIYWHGDQLLAEGKNKEGTKVLSDLATTRGFYPMVAAQRLNIPYVVRATKSAKIKSKNFESLEEVKRIRELLYWDQENTARSEWNNLLLRQSPDQKESFARYAFEQNWADLSVQATISGKLWDHLEERFPIAYPEIFNNAIKGKQISATFAMAIARQESAWNTQAYSSAGARGLMQLMPQTAKETASKIKMSDYKNNSQLFNPDTNIKLGTEYLNYTYQRFNNNRILAAAAYNAGPHRVTTWLNRSNKTLNVIAFIESIPFNETRSYVKNVLSYDVFYNHFMNKKSTTVLTDNEWNFMY